MIWLDIFAHLLFQSISSHWEAEFVYAFWFCFHLSLYMLRCNSKAFKKGRMVWGLECTNRILETSGLGVMLPQPSSVILGRLLSLWLIFLFCKRDMKILSLGEPCIKSTKKKKKNHKGIDLVRTKNIPHAAMGKGCWKCSLCSAAS